MGEFFKGWRRKAGLVTLAMACLLAAGWMRSYAKIDVLWTEVANATCLIQSANGGIRVWYPSRTLFNNSSGWHEAESRNQEEHEGIPYWSLVLPLTLLSAWLILVRRPRGRAVDSDPSQI